MKFALNILKEKTKRPSLIVNYIVGKESKWCKTPFLYLLYEKNLFNLFS
ncbi:hypothetical protein HMPREF9184_00759 [Streptococcus sp. oral taxon 058 str. F0407]|nr:hypothetical protein HMPREF9184_00759 [Streptococcus sp. oral taxon 058 str. F0407]